MLAVNAQAGNGEILQSAMYSLAAYTMSGFLSYFGHSGPGDVSTTRSRNSAVRARKPGVAGRAEPKLHGRFQYYQTVPVRELSPQPCIWSHLRERWRCSGWKQLWMSPPLFAPRRRFFGGSIHSTNQAP